MSDINYEEFLNGLTPEQVTAFAAKMFASQGAAVNAALSASPAAQALVSQVVKPARTAAKGPSFWDLFWADQVVLGAAAAHLGLELDTPTEQDVFGALYSRLDKASVSGTFERKDANGIVNKMRVTLIDETDKTSGAIRKKIALISKAANVKAMTAAVEAALSAIKSGRALPATATLELTEEVNGAKSAAEATLAAASEPPPAADLPAQDDTPPPPPA